MIGRSRSRVVGTYGRPSQARVTPDFRRSVVAGVLAVVALTAAAYLDGIRRGPTAGRLASLGCTLVFVVAAVIALRSVAGELRVGTEARVGAAVAAALRVLTLVVGYVAVAVTVLGLLEVPLDRLLVGGAVTGIIVGIAAQQALGNAFAGLVLLLTRPFSVGDQILLRSGALGGEYHGAVIDIGLAYVSLRTDSGVFALPNAGVLAAATLPKRTAPGRPEDPTTAVNSVPATRNGSPTRGPSPGVSDLAP